MALRSPGSVLSLHRRATYGLGFVPFVRRRYLRGPLTSVDSVTVTIILLWTVTFMTRRKHGVPIVGCLYGHSRTLTRSPFHHWAQNCTAHRHDRNRFCYELRNLRQSGSLSGITIPLACLVTCFAGPAWRAREHARLDLQRFRRHGRQAGDR